MKKRKETSATPPVEETLDVVRKPGVESSCIHIAEMFVAKNQQDIAKELTRQLRPTLPRRLGVYG